MFSVTFSQLLGVRITFLFVNSLGTATAINRTTAAPGHMFINKNDVRLIQIFLLSEVVANSPMRPICSEIVLRRRVTRLYSNQISYNNLMNQFQKMDKLLRLNKKYA